MDEFEKELRSWVPRRPSEALRERIFSSRPAVRESEPTFHLNWLAPVTAALVVFCTVLSQHSVPSLQRSDAGSMVAMILSNQSAAAYLPCSVTSGQNALPMDSFEWTNGHRSGSVSGLSRP